MSEGKKKRVFILGAGASDHAGGPLVKDLMSPEDKRHRRILEKAVRIAERCDIPARRMTFELLLTEIDVRMLSAHEGTMEPSELARARGLLARYVHARCGNLSDTGNKTREFCKQLRDGDTVVTFNYDILIEQALYKQGLWSMKGGYGIPEAYHMRPIHRLPPPDKANDPPIVRDPPNGLVRVLKPHGSVNFRSRVELLGAPEGTRMKPAGSVFIKPGDFSGYRGGFFYQQPEAIKEPTSEDEFNKMEEEYERTQPPDTMVLPSFVKRYANALPFVRHAWHEAYEAVRESHETWIIGYSIPDGDTDAHLLLTGRNRNIPNWKFHIVDPKADDVAKRLSPLVSLNPDAIGERRKERFEDCDWHNALGQG